MLIFHPLEDKVYYKDKWISWQAYKGKDVVINLTLKSGEKVSIKVGPEQLELFKQKLEEFKETGTLDLSLFKIMKEVLE